MSRTALLGIILFLVASAVFGWAYFNLNSSSKNKKTQPSSPKVEILKPDGTVVLPFDINDPAVIGAQVTYVFTGTITKVKRISEGTELTTDIQIQALPRFIVTPQTQIFYFDQAKSKQTKYKNLKAGQKVEIVAAYGLKVRRWFVQRVRILVTKLPGSTPRPTSPSPTPTKK